ncbi:MAG TPA: hypothetical protein VGH75_11705 [Steroidobacteraceae bacterium]
MSDSKVVPFRRRPPSQAELEVYQRMTRHWSPTLRQMMFPELFNRAQDKVRRTPRR